MARVGPQILNEADGTDQSLQNYGEPLLRTKLFVPPFRPKRVIRSGLVDLINTSLDKALILISAPAGFGKTTLLAEWEAQARLPVAWLSLDGGDNDPNRFLRYVIAALNTCLAKQGANPFATAQAMLQSVQRLPVQSILVALINEITDLCKPFALVLDDYQLISAPAVNVALTFLLEHLPSSMHLMIASRVDPSLPLHRLRAAQSLLEIRTEEMRFTDRETAAFMNEVMELSLSEEDLLTLSNRTEGWIVGLQMTALSMRGITDRSAFVRSLNGSHRYILEYLIEEVLNSQPDKIQSFLLRTSILERICAPLCDAILADQEDHQSILEYLERSNIFLTPLDEVGYWYRYHHLFADLLRARLQRKFPDCITNLHFRASQWYEEAALPEEAIWHAFAAKDLNRTASLVEQSAVNIMSRGEMSSILGLIEALPENLIHNRPALGVYYALALTFSGQHDKTKPLLQQIEKQIPTGDTSLQAKEVLGSIAIIRGLLADFQGNMAAAIELAQRADELLPDNKLAERSLIPFVLGDGYVATGKLLKAEQAFEKIKQLGQATGNPWTVSVALHKLALVKKLQGKLRQVESLYQEAIQFASGKGGQRYGSIGATYVGLSDLLREWNEIAAARLMVSRAIEDMERWQSPTDLVNGFVTQARIALAQGDLKLSQMAIEKAETIARQGNLFPITRVTLESCQVRLWLARGDLATLDQWLNEKLLDENRYGPPPGLDFIRELEWMSVARVCLSREKVDRALDILMQLMDAAESAGRIGRLIEILVLMALALQKSGDQDQAVRTMKRSLVLAEPEGYMRVFLDEGKDAEDLLEACRSCVAGSQNGYLDELLKTFLMTSIEKTSHPSSQPESLAETLTEREMEVLQLLAAGLSNQAIAERLYLSEGTIKTHTHHLYGKLGVQSRTQAIARARELVLI